MKSVCGTIYRDGCFHFLVRYPDALVQTCSLRCADDTQIMSCTCTNIIALIMEGQNSLKKSNCY